MSTSILREKSFVFAVQIVKFCQKMKQERREFALFDQLLDSGTAPGALSREAQYAESTLDFKHKLMIALKEATEAEYWLDLIAASYPNVEIETIDLKKDYKEIIAILVASTKTIKGKLKSNSLVSKPLTSNCYVLTSSYNRSTANHPMDMNPM